MILINTVTSKPVAIGDKVTSFRGEESIVLGMTEPRHSGSTGRMRVDHGEYFPSVFKCEWQA